MQFIKCCDTCAKCKGETCATLGLLQPLPIPQQVWQHISLDFIEHLPKSRGKGTILVVFCRFTKYASHPFAASTVAKVFLDNVYKLHVAPQTMVSTRDKGLTSLF